MKYTAKHRIHDFHQWDAEIDDAVQQFKQDHGKYPNIILASQWMYSKIDNMADYANVCDKDGSPVSSKLKPPINGFVGEGYNLEFCLDKKSDKCNFVLVHDEKARFIY